AVGVAGQVQGSHRTAYSIDFLLERKVPVGGAVSVEAEWAKYDSLGGYDPHYGNDQGGYVLGSFLFPALSGPGRFEVLGKFAHAHFSEGVTSANPNYEQDTTEINLNYVVKQFNLRVMSYYKDTHFDGVFTNFKLFGVGLQIQM